MPGRLFLIHWNQAEAEGHAARLREAGWQVEVEAEDGARAGKAVQANAPQAVVIYLTRLPSHGRRTAHYLKETKATRHVPIVFVGGQGEPLEKTKAKVPDAVYTTEEGLHSALSRITAENSG